MSYWGEAVADNHPIWGDPWDTETARQALAQLPAAPAPAAREQAYLGALAGALPEAEASDGALVGRDADGVPIRFVAA